MSGPYPLRILHVGPSIDDRGGIAHYIAFAVSHPVGEEVWALATTSSGSRLRGAAVFAGALGRLPLLLRRVDVVHLHASHRASLIRKSLATVIVRIARKPLVVHLHGASASWYQTRLAERQGILFRFVLRAADVVVSLSDEGLPVLEAEVRPGVPVVRMYNPAYVPEVCIAPWDEREPLVVFVGELCERKGWRLLVEAAAAFAPPVRFVLFGNGEVEEARELARAVAPEMVEVPGWVDPLEVATSLARARCFVLPSQSEGLPLALLQAMALGAVPVVTTAGAMAEVVEHGVSGFVVDREDEKALREAIKRILNDDGTMSEGAARRAGEVADPAAHAAALRDLHRSVSARTT